MTDKIVVNTVSPANCRKLPDQGAAQHHHIADKIDDFAGTGFWLCHELFILQKKNGVL